jgi:SAM-dependent methyltransferase
MASETSGSASGKDVISKSNAVGAAWRARLSGAGYTSAGDIRLLSRFRESPYIQTIARYAQMSPGNLVLEPGCGSGKFSLALASFGCQVVALDYVGEVLSGVRATEQTLSGQWSHPLAGYCQGNLEQLPFDDNCFDLVVNEGVVEHWLEEQKRLAVLREMVRVTRAGGVVAILVPNGVHPLISLWERKLPGFRSAPPMTYYSATRLREELASVGLYDIMTDGVYPWRSWTRVPPWNRLYLIAALLDRILPIPPVVRRAWGINLVGMGRKGQ